MRPHQPGQASPGGGLAMAWTAIDLATAPDQRARLLARRAARTHRP
ncbi:hypothetical protein [Streptomyces sp. NPDC093089]